MDKTILKIDLDFHKRSDCIELLRDRLSYMHDLKFFLITKIKKIVLVKKTNYSAKIYLNKPISETLIIFLQLLLNSDYRKEVNTIINHFILKMKYSNRMFDVKRYKDGTIKEAFYFDVTKQVKSYVLKKDRIKHKN